MKRRTAFRYWMIVAAMMALAGCNGHGAISGTLPAQPRISSASPASYPPAQSGGGHPTSTAPSEPRRDVETPEAGRSYIDQAAQEAASRILKPGMSEYERAKTAFDHMIDTTHLAEPVGLELWRIRGDKEQRQPSYVENRSLSVLLYGIGMCEDYAAAFTMLLRAMGLEAEYVPGLTYSTEGALVDHAWVVAKIDGSWYHLDCQLEDNISRHGAVRYRYFMKSDTSFAASHRWGKNLIDSRLLSAEQNEEIARNYIPPSCPQDYPTPARRALTSAPVPDTAVIQSEIEAEFREYERINGPLEPLELDIIPPVFALEGYGPPG